MRIKSKRQRYRSLSFNADLLGGPPLPPEPITLQEALFKFNPPYPGRLVSSGFYTGTYSPSASTVGPIGLRTYYIPIQIPYTVLIDQLSIYITLININVQVRLGIFSIERGKVMTYIDSNILIPDSIGVKSIQLNSLLTPGSYALAYLADGLITVRTFAALKGLLGAIDPNSAIDTTHYISKDSVVFNDGFADNPEVILDTSTIGPHIFARVG